MFLLSSGRSYTKDPAPNASYPDINDVELTDDRIDQHTCASITCCDVGWNAGVPTIVIDLVTQYDISEVKIRYGEAHTGGIYEPNQVVIKGSMNNVDWDTLTTFTDFPVSGDGCYWQLINGLSGIYRYVKFEFTRADEWLMLSELQVLGSSPFHLAGTVKEKGSAVVRTVKSYVRSTGELYDTTTSEADGSFSVGTPDAATVMFVVAFDDEAGDQYNALIFDRVKGVAV